VITKTKFRL